MTPPNLPIPRTSWWPLLALGATVACSGGESSSNVPSSQTSSPDEAPMTNEPPGIHMTADDVLFRTEPFTLGPGEEKFICYTQTLDQDLAIAGYGHGAKRFLHHVIFAKTTGTEPEGASDCDVLYRFEWEPLFLAGAGATDIRFPEGIGHKLPAGTRILAQMHLLNAGVDSVTDSVDIHMHPSDVPNLRPMGSYAFGNFGVSLPPHQTSTLTSDCTVPEKVQFVAGFPHMHLLGQSLTFETGPSPDQLTKVFERSPYTFDDQRLDLMDLTLNPGDATRVTCHYDNPNDETVTFGESTKNEMCFFLAFVADRQGVGGCVVGVPPGLGG